MPRLRNVTFVALLCSMGCQSSSPPATQPAPETPKPVPIAKPKEDTALKQMLSWLPADTETLVVARGPFAVEVEEESEEDEDEDTVLNLEEVLRSFCLSSAATIQDGRFFKEMAGWEVTLAAQGSRRFRPPKALGQFLYEGADIVCFKKGTPLEPFMKKLEKDAVETFEAFGRTISVHKEMLEQDEWTFYFALPRPDVLVVATHKSYLLEVLHRIDNPSELGAFPPDYPEWKLLDPKARVWAMRHYIRGSEDHPSAESFHEDDSAKGMVFFPSEKGPTGRVRLLSTSEHTFKAVQGTFNGEGLTSEVIHEKGVVEVYAQCDNPRGASFFIFVLLAYLGHVIFI